MIFMSTLTHSDSWTNADPTIPFTDENMLNRPCFALFTVGVWPDGYFFTFSLGFFYLEPGRFFWGSGCFSAQR